MSGPSEVAAVAPAATWIVVVNLAFVATQLLTGVVWARRGVAPTAPTTTTEPPPPTDQEGSGRPTSGAGETARGVLTTAPVRPPATSLSLPARLSALRVDAVRLDAACHTLMALGMAAMLVAMA